MKMKIIVLIFAILALIIGTAYADSTATATSSTTSSQGQGQDQNQTTSLDNVANPTQTTTVDPTQTTSLDMFNNSFNSETRRGFVIPADTPMAPVIGTYHQPTPSYGFQDVKGLLLYTCWFTEGSLMSILDKVEDVESEFKVATELLADAKPAEDGTRWIKIVVSVKKGDKVIGANLKGFVTSWSEDPDTTMTEVMAKGALDALRNGCNVYHISGQGAVRDAIANGWGIGFNTTQAQIYGGGEDRSNVTSGGFGYSHAEAGTRDKAWLQGYGLVVEGISYPKLKEVVAAE